MLGESGAENRAVSFINSVLKLDGDKVLSVKFVPESFYSVDNLSRAIQNDIKIEGLCKTSLGKRFIVEIHRKRVSGDSNHWVYYSSREIVEQGRAYYSSIPDMSTDPKKRKIALAKFYEKLYPVKMIVVMDFDSPTSQNELQNHSSDVLVHWGVCELSTHKIASNLISWTFVVLPRFLKLLSAGKALNVRDSSLNAWLYLLTRSENSEVDISSSTTADHPEVVEGIKRLANLSEKEKMALSIEQEKEIIDQGILQAEIDDRILDGLKEGQKKIAKNIMKTLPDTDDATISTLTTLSIAEIQSIRRLD